MELEIKLGGKVSAYHVSGTCNINVIVRNGKVVEILESKKPKSVE